MPCHEEHIAVLLQQAQAAQRGGDGGSRERLLREVLKLQADHPVAANALGMIALSRDPIEAERLFLTATTGDPRSPDIWMNVATARRACANHAGERSALDAAIAIDQRHLMANVRLAEWHEKAGEKRPALYRWEGVAAMLSAVPASSEAHQRLLAHARDKVAQGTGHLATAVDNALAATRAAAASGELRRIDACVDAMLGRRRIFHNEPHGLHFPFLPADEFFDEAHFPWLAELEAQTPAIRREVEALLAAPDSGFMPYVEARSGAPESRWTALAGSDAWSSLCLWKYGIRQEETCARCPATAAALARVPLAHIPDKGPTAFFSVLKPGARLPAHTGVSNVRAIVHLPLIVPPGCGFRVGGETREWVEGRAFAFDDTIEHEAWNGSDTIRAVLILDVWNPHLTAAERAALCTLFATLSTMEDVPPERTAVAD